MLESKPNPTRCQAYIHNGGRSVSFHQCLQKPKVKRGGKLYCGIHDPVEVEKRRVARELKWKQEWAVKEQGWKRKEDRNKLYDRMVRHLKEFTANPEWLEATERILREADRLELPGNGLGRDKGKGGLK